VAKVKRDKRFYIMREIRDELLDLPATPEQRRVLRMCIGRIEQDTGVPMPKRMGMI